MKAPQILYIVLACISLGICIHRHGEPRTGYHNFWVDLIGFLIGFGIVYWGGFFD